MSLGLTRTLIAGPVAVRHPQGYAHGFLEVTDLNGVQLAVGDVIQRVHGDQVTSRVTLHFLDGSLDDDTTVFTQRRVFHLISDHHVQSGPSFPKPIDVTLNTGNNSVTSRDEKGAIQHDHLEMLSDVSNGLPPNLLMNLSPSDQQTTISFVVPATKPRLVHLVIKKEGEAVSRIGKSPFKAVNYAVHVELGGVVGAVAPVVGKQPPITISG